MTRKWIPLIVLGLLVCAGDASAQRPGHFIGSLWYGTDSDGIQLYWPGGLNETRTNPDISYHAGRSEMDPVTAFSNFNVPSYFAKPGMANTTIPKWVNDRTDDLADFSSSFFLGAPDIPSPKTFRVPPPQLIQDGRVVLRDKWRIFQQANVKDQVRPDLTADLMVEGQSTDSGGILVRTQTFSYATPAYDDFVFEVLTITYPKTPFVPDLRVGERGSAPNPETAQKNPALKDFYFGLHWFMQNAARGPAGGAHITVVPGDPSRSFTAGLAALGIFDEVNYWDDKQKIMYSHDGDASDRAGYRPDGDDRGEPAPGPGAALDRVREALVDPGEFLESYYKGRIFLHVDKTPVTDLNTLSANWLEDANEPDPERRQPRLARWVLDANWTSTANSDRARVYDFYTQLGTSRAERIEVSDPLKPGFTKPKEQFYEWLTVWGPWDLKLGESIHIVSALAVNGPSLDENKRVGKLYLEGKISAAEKEKFLDSGFDSMMVSINAARQAWANRKVLTGIGLAPSLPLGPAYPARFEVKSGPDQNELSWDAVTGAVKYRVYRTLGFETRPRGQVAEVTTTSYTDKTVIRGTRYFYAVTAVDKDGRESSFFATRTEGGGISPFRSPAKRISDVRVVPNPFQIRGGEVTTGGFNFPGQPNKLLFVNLPAKAIIRVFTIGGDLVQEIQHTSGSGDESWNLMVSDNNQFLVSGIYFAHIQSLDPSVPGTHVERFIVVR